MLSLIDSFFSIRLLRQCRFFLSVRSFSFDRLVRKSADSSTASATRTHPDDTNLDAGTMADCCRTPAAATAAAAAAAAAAAGEADGGWGGGKKK